MQNFDYVTPTRLLFGRDSIEKLPEVMRPLGKRVLLTYGGGSIKKIGLLYDGDPWDLIIDEVETKAALPIVDIMTVAATGSEWDNGGVISRTDTHDKVSYVAPCIFPVCSILDPVFTFSVSKLQTAAGCADAMNHVMEQYFTDETTLLNDGFCESVHRSCRDDALLYLWLQRHSVAGQF